MRYFNCKVETKKKDPPNSKIDTVLQSPPCYVQDAEYLLIIFKTFLLYKNTSLCSLASELRD